MKKMKQCKTEIVLIICHVVGTPLRRKAIGIAMSTVSTIT